MALMRFPSLSFGGQYFSHMALRLSVILAGFFMLCACASMGGMPDDKSDTEAEAIATQLPPQTLASGECGLFIWSADATRRFILFSAAQSGRALWHDGEDVWTLSFEGHSGAPIYDQYPAQDYSVISTQTGLQTRRHVSLKLSDAEETDTAMRFKSGRLTVAGPSEWDTVIPVVGLASCQL